jgi:hypothetical protein
MRYVARHVDDVCRRRLVIYGWSQDQVERWAERCNRDSEYAHSFNRVVAGEMVWRHGASWCVVDTQDGHR